MAARVDPGIGDPKAPVGSREWAQYFRLNWLAVKHDLHVAPESFVSYFRKGLKERVWTLLHGPDGSLFKTFDEFCRAPEPWGFNKPWSELRPFLVGVCSERELDLVTVAPAQHPEPGPGRGHKTEDAKRPSFRSSTLDKAHRAIAERAPEPVRDLYKADLIGQKEAARLGPKNPTPDEAAKVTEVAIKAAEVAKANKGKPAREVKREVNKAVRAALGIASDTPEQKAAKAASSLPEPEKVPAIVADRIRFVQSAYAPLKGEERRLFGIELMRLGAQLAQSK